MNKAYMPSAPVQPEKPGAKPPYSGPYVVISKTQFLKPHAIEYEVPTWERACKLMRQCLTEGATSVEVNFV